MQITSASEIIRLICEICVQKTTDISVLLIRGRLFFLVLQTHKIKTLREASTVLALRVLIYLSLSEILFHHNLLAVNDIQALDRSRETLTCETEYRLLTAVSLCDALDSGEC